MDTSPPTSSAMATLQHAPKECQHLTNPAPFPVLLAAFILLGILVSYLPQHLKIISRRSSDGLSPWWVLLGGLSSVAAIANILVLPQSRRDMQCCRQISSGECAAAMLGVGQIGLQWACFMFIVMLFLTFYPVRPLASKPPQETPPTRRPALLVGASIVIAILVVLLASLILLASSPRLTQYWADILGTVAGSLAMIQYVPQIYYTWRAGDLKSLSILTMIIQVPGAFLFAFSLWLRVGWKGWSTWLVYIVTGLLQSILLAMAIAYWLAGRRAAEDSSEDEESITSVDDVDGAAEAQPEAADERSALLPQVHTSESLPVRRQHGNSLGTQRSSASTRQLSMLYAATPPEHDSDRSSGSRKG